MCIEGITSLRCGHEARGIIYCVAEARYLEDECPHHRVFRTHIEDICYYCSPAPVSPTAPPVYFRSHDEVAKKYLTAAYGALEQSNQEPNREDGTARFGHLPPPPPYHPTSEFQALESPATPSTSNSTNPEMETDQEEENDQPPSKSRLHSFSVLKHINSSC